MSQPSLEERVAALERQVAELRAVWASKPGVKDWQSTIGMFPYDETAKRVDAAIKKAREADRRRARHRQEKLLGEEDRS